MIKISLLLIFFITSAQADILWEVNRVSPKKKVRRFSIKDDDKVFSIPLKDSKWKCYLSKVSEGKETYGRSIDCRYDKGPAYFSSKLICHKIEFKGFQVNSFAVAEEGGAGFLLELLCSHKAPSK